MGKSLKEIAEELKNANKKVQLIYAFNGTGKTRLSRVFKELVAPKEESEEKTGELAEKKILYYSAFTEDLFYWDNDLENDIEPKLKIQPNSFTKWVFEEQGQDQEIIRNFQHYTDEKLNPKFNFDFSEVTFSYERGDDKKSGNIKISKGEESCFIWNIFYSLIEQVVNVLNIAEEDERETNQLDNIEYIFIDDPVTSLDENNIIEIAVDLAQLIKKSESNLKFVITTHNPLFYNVLHNEFKKEKSKKHFLKRYDNGKYELVAQNSDSPFSYHLYLKDELEKAIKTGQIKKYHFNFLRNILEKTSTFLGYESWGDLLPKEASGKTNPYEARIINISSHSKNSSDEVVELTDNDKRVLEYLLNNIKSQYKFK